MLNKYSNHKYNAHLRIAKKYAADEKLRALAICCLSCSSRNSNSGKQFMPNFDKSVLN